MTDRLFYPRCRNPRAKQVALAGVVAGSAPLEAAAAGHAENTSESVEPELACEALGCSAPDHDNVIAQAKDGAN
jgi:hypothetical protein